MSSSDHRVTMVRITARASSGVRQPCSPDFGLRTRNCECWPPRQWIVRTTSRAASSTSAMMSVTRARRSRWRVRMLTPGAIHAASRSSAKPAKSGDAAAGSGVRTATNRAWHASTRRSAASQLFSSCAAIRRLSGSQAAYRRSASEASYWACCSDHPRLDQAAEFEQVMPVAAVAGKPGGVKTQYGADLSGTEPCNQPLEAGPRHHPAGGAAEIVIDHLDVAEAPLPRDIDGIVLPSLALEIGLDLCLG